MSIRDFKQERKFESFTLPSGMGIRIRSLWKSDQRIARKLAPPDDKGTPNPFLDDVYLSLAVVDDNGNQEISEKEALEGFFDRFDLGESQMILRRVFRLSGMLEEQQLSVEDAIKNSGAIPGNGSSGG